MRKGGVLKLEQILDIIKVIVAVVGTLLTFLFGTWDHLIQALVAFAVLDYLTGIGAAGKEGKLSARIGLWGVAKKVAMFVIVAVAHMVDGVLNLNDPLLRTAAISWLIGTEGISIAENLGRLGVGFPDFIRNAFESLRGKGENTDV